MKEKLNALFKNHTWDLVTLPPRKSVVSCKWIYKTKTLFDGSTKCCKACPLAKGFTQEYGIDYEVTFAPVSRIFFVHALLVVAITSKWELFQIDVNNAFFKGNLSEKVYMQPPLNLSIELNNICHLQHAFYCNPVSLKRLISSWNHLFYSIRVQQRIRLRSPPNEFSNSFQFLFKCKTYDI